MMITVYFLDQDTIQYAQLTLDDRALLNKAIWIDMYAPTKDEEKFIEAYTEIDIPTKKEMAEIELSNRLYIEDESLFMTTTMVAYSDFPLPKSESVTFILFNDKLITVRYSELHAFSIFSQKLIKYKLKKYNSLGLLLGLLDSVIERLADVLENINHAFDDVSQTIFHESNEQKQSYEKILQTIGANGELNTKARDSMMSFNRMITFLEQVMKKEKQTESHLKIIKNDMQALSDYAGFISTKVNFLLDATLGLVNIAQNNIIKIFSIAAVIFLPPTLIASLYGMNFKFMPELTWKFGYPLAIFLMVLSALIPLTYFKIKKWI